MVLRLTTVICQVNDSFNCLMDKRGLLIHSVYDFFCEDYIRGVLETNIGYYFIKWEQFKFFTLCFTVHEKLQTLFLYNKKTKTKKQKQNTKNPNNKHGKMVEGNLGRITYSFLKLVSVSLALVRLS